MTDAGTDRPQSGLSVAIRADGSSRIGLGHVMRCLSLAAAVRRAGGEPLFIGKGLGGVAEGLVRARGFAYASLGDHLDEAADREVTLRIVREAGAGVLLIDHYGLGPATHRYFRDAGVPLALVDDEVKVPGLECDLLLNQNVGVHEQEYAESPARVKLCGTAYVMLRDEFLRQRPWQEKSESDLHLVISLGGADPENVTRTAAEGASACGALGTITVVAGPAYEHADSLGALLAADSRITLARRPENMAALLASADLAITAGGSTCYECAYLGLPNLIIQIAQNQARVCRGLAAAGCAAFVGLGAGLTPGTMARAVSGLADDVPLRRSMGARGKGLVDGRGAERVARALLALPDSRT